MFCRKIKDFMWNQPFWGEGHRANLAGNWTTVMVGFPACDEAALECPPAKMRTNDRFLPRILVHLGFFKSNSEAIRQCKDWKITWGDDESAFEMIRLAKNGKRKAEFVAIIVGPKTVPEVKCSKPSRVAVRAGNPPISWDTPCFLDDCPHCNPE